MDQLAGIFFNLNAVNTDDPPVGKGEVSVSADGLFQLRDLVGFGKIGVTVVFAHHAGGFGDFAVQGKPGALGEFHDVAVEPGQCARQTDTHRAAVGVGGAAKGCGAAAENFCSGGKLHMGLQTADQLKFCHGGTSLQPHAEGRTKRKPGGLFKGMGGI